MKEILKKLNACKESIEWVGDKTIEQAINECPRGDWMLWLFQKVCPDDLRLLTLAKGHCANTVRHLMSDELSIKAVDVAIAFGEGKASRKELDSAYASADSADSAYASADSAYASAAAAYASDSASASADSASAAYASDSASAAYAAYAYFAASDSASASAAAAYAAAYDYSAYAYFAASDSASASAAAKISNQLETANICRKYLGEKLIKGLKEVNND